MAELNYSKIESKWQKAWQKKKIEIVEIAVIA
jgi:leucyl-tRNA synthetase